MQVLYGVVEGLIADVRIIIMMFLIITQLVMEVGQKHLERQRGGFFGSFLGGGLIYWKVR